MATRTVMSQPFPNSSWPARPGSEKQRSAS
jgi:hypothetical protein